MTMVVPLLELLVGLALIVKGGEWFVESSVQLGRLLRLPRVVIGSTLVSLATTTPEMGVSITSGAVGEPSLAIGNAVGSCICNIGLILGTTAAIRHIEVHTRAIRRALAALACFGLLVFVMTLDLHLARWQGVALVIAGFSYFVWEFWRNWREREPGKIRAADEVERKIVSHGAWWTETRTGTALQFVGGIGAVIVGSRWLVEGAVASASWLRIPPIILGFTVVAVGTSLPEFITALTASRKAVSDLSVGNIIGANIANLTIVPGTAAAFQEVAMTRLTQAISFPMMIIVVGALAWMLLARHGLTRRDGIALIVTYAAYVAVLIWFTVERR